LRSGRFWGHVALWLLMGATVGSILYGLAVGRVRSVMWHGAHYLDVSKLRANLEWTVVGQPMMAVSTRAITESLRRVPVVRHVVVRKQWPDTIHVFIVERKPFAVLQDATGVRLVDAEGVPFLWFQGDLNDPAWRPLIVYNGVGRPDARFYPVRAVVEVLRRDHAWLLDQTLWLRWGPEMALELSQPQTRILLTDDCGPDVERCRRWYRRRLQELRAQWDEQVLPQVLRERKEIDLRFDGYIYLRPLRDGS